MFLIFSFSLVMLWGEWVRQNQPIPQITTPTSSVPAAVLEHAKPEQETITTVEAHNPIIGQSIMVKTDTMAVEISSSGGNIRHLDLLKHQDTNDQTKPLTLFEYNGDHIYGAQTGLLGKGLPNHNAEYAVDIKEYSLDQNKDSIEVRLTAVDTSNAHVMKVYTFHRASYLIDVGYEIENKSTTPINTSAYYQLVRDSVAAGGESKFVPTYTGPAVFTEQDKFQKIDFSSIEKNKVSLPNHPDNGWIGMLQHYFVSAWIPAGKGTREFYTKQLDGKLFSAGVVLPVNTIEPGQIGRISSTLYAGPAQTKLDEIAPGLGLTVDYGWLTIFSTPLFWLMSLLNSWVNNWGIAIILLTVLIKLVFFPLSAASYRSMAKMRVVAPKLEKIKQQYGDDREKLNRAMMDLYKNEKINPLGGCLPMLIQIPVFIALYWAILSSVELRHAPFFGWIQDLSATDPYYVLPLIMGVSMLVQSKLNPVPPDPLQAKLMQAMPIVFSVVFFFFPAGLVLYSVVNNLLSIAQQWYITRGLDSGLIGEAKA